MAHPVVHAAVMHGGSPAEPIDRALEIARPSQIRQHPELEDMGEAARANGATVMRAESAIGVISAASGASVSHTE